MNLKVETLSRMGAAEFWGELGFRVCMVQEIVHTFRLLLTKVGPDRWAGRNINDKSHTYQN